MRLFNGSVPSAEKDRTVISYGEQTAVTRTLELRLRRAADTVLPQDGGVVHERELEFRLQVKVLPASHGHGRVEDVGDVQRHTQRHVGLHQVQHLRGGTAWSILKRTNSPDIM